MEWWNIWQLQWSWFSGRLCSAGLWRSSDCQQGEVTATSPTVMFQGGIISFVCGRQTIRVERNPDKVWVISVQFTVLQLWLQQDFNSSAPVMVLGCPSYDCAWCNHLKEISTSESTLSHSDLRFFFLHSYVSCALICCNDLLFGN